MDQRSPVHEIVNALWRALHALGPSDQTNEIEKWGFSIHAALSAPGREFHNHAMAGMGPAVPTSGPLGHPTGAEDV